MKKVAYFLSGVALLGAVAFAADGSSKTGKISAPTKEQRQKMADLHEKMAACLKSDRLISDCRKEMVRDCKDASGSDNCPMMGGKMERGMRHRRVDSQNQENE